MELELGQIVFSKRGRDRGAAYVVVKVFNDNDGKPCAYLADGNRRTLDKPKKKKAIHIQVTKTVVTLDLTHPTIDAEIRKLLKAHNPSSVLQ